MIDGRLARWLAAAILAAGMACWVLRLSLRRMVLLRLRLRWAGRQEAFSDAAPAAVPVITHFASSVSVICMLFPNRW